MYTTRCVCMHVCTRFWLSTFNCFRTPFGEGQKSCTYPPHGLAKARHGLYRIHRRSAKRHMIKHTNVQILPTKTIIQWYRYNYYNCCCKLMCCTGKCTISLTSMNSWGVLLDYIVPV